MPAPASAWWPGGPHERIGVGDLAVEHGVDGGQHAAGREQRDLVGAGPERRQPAGVAAVVVRERLDALDVGALVEAADLVDGRHARLDGAQLRRHPGDVEQVLEAALGERVLGVDVGLDPAAGRERSAARAPCRATCSARARPVPSPCSLSFARQGSAGSVEFRRDRVPRYLLARPAVARHGQRRRAHGQGPARRALHGRDRRGRDAPRRDGLRRLSRRLAPERVGRARRQPGSSRRRPSRRSSKANTAENRVQELLDSYGS